MSELNSREKQLDAKEHKVDGKLIILSRRQSEVDSEAKKLIGFSELDSKEILLERREGIDSREKRLDAREHEVDGKEKILSRRQSEIDSKLMIRFSELDSKELFLEGRENDVGAKEKILARRENELVLKEMMLGIRSTDLESRAKVLEKRENTMHSELEKMERKKSELLKKTKELVNLVMERGLQEHLYDSNLSPGVPENSLAQFIEEPISRNSAKCAEVVRRRKKRCLDSRISDVSQQMNMEGSSSQQIKRNCSCGSNGQLQPHVHQKSGSMDNFASKSTGDPSSFDSGTVEEELVRNVNIGEVWACFDSKYKLPTSHAQVIRVVDMDGKVWLEVAWLKPHPVYDGENEWIDSGLPVTCGMFCYSAVNIVSPRILCNQVSCVGESPWTILPREGETWAIYKDWDIIAWSSDPSIHQYCKYEIVEILAHPQVESTGGVRVGYLERLMGFRNSFQRRSNNRENPFLIDCTCLYRFSHKVRSVHKDCIDANGSLHRTFELDQKCLPKELR